MSTHDTDNTARLRSWLYILLAQLEMNEISEAKKIEYNSYHIGFDITFKVAEIILKEGKK